MSDMHKMNKNNIFDFVLTLPVEGSVFFIPTFPHRPCPSRAQNRKFNIADQGMRVSNIYSSKCSFRMEWKVIGFVQSLKYYDSIVKKKQKKVSPHTLFLLLLFIPTKNMNWKEEKRNGIKSHLKGKETNRHQSGNLHCHLCKNR